MCIRTNTQEVSVTVKGWTPSHRPSLKLTSRVARATSFFLRLDSHQQTNTMLRSTSWTVVEKTTQKRLNTDSTALQVLAAANNHDDSPLCYKGESCSHLTVKRSGVGPARQTASISEPVQPPSLSASPPPTPRESLVHRMSAGREEAALRRSRGADGGRTAPNSTAGGRCPLRCLPRSPPASVSLLPSKQSAHLPRSQRSSFL